MKTKMNDDLPVLVNNPIYNHPDLELIPYKPIRGHGPQFCSQDWKEFYQKCLAALAKKPIKEVRDRLIKEMGNARRNYKNCKKREQERFERFGY